MERLSKRNLCLVGLTLFSMFFGAGNLIFPPFLGAMAGTNTWTAMAEMCIRDRVNGASLFGGVFDSASAVVRKLCKSGRIHFLGTDSHGTHYRKPQIKKAAAWIHDNCPASVAEGILCGNPMAVLEDKLF